MSEQPFAISVEEMYGDPGLDDTTIEAITPRRCGIRSEGGAQ